MVLGNQLVKVQQMGQLQQSQQNQQQQGQTQKPQLVNASNNSSNNGNNNSDTVVLTTSGPLKVQPNPGASGLAGNRTNIILSSSLKVRISTHFKFDCRFLRVCFIFAECYKNQSARSSTKSGAGDPKWTNGANAYPTNNLTCQLPRWLFES